MHIKLLKNIYIEVKFTYYKINYVIYSTKNELGDLLNKNEISAFAIKDANIAKQVYKLIKEGD